MFGNALSPYSLEPCDPRVEFWSDQSEWPNDAPGYIFLGRALLSFGSHRFGNLWNDDLPKTVLIRELSETLSIYTPYAEINRAVAVLNKRSEAYRNRCGYRTILGPPGSGDDFPTREEWAEARAIFGAAATEAWSQLKLYLITAIDLAEACKAGAVKSATRPIEGGPITHQEWHFWNGERCWHRFDTCRVVPTDPFVLANDHAQEHWLYLERASFDALVSGGMKHPPSQEIEIKPHDYEQKERKPGRRPNEAWDSITGRFARLVHFEGITNTPTLKISEKLYLEASERFDDPPSIEAIRKKVAIWRRELEED